MADHTPSSGTSIKAYRSANGGPPVIRGYPESTVSSTFAAGALVELASGTNTHRLTVASSLSTGYVGVAADAASSVRDNVVPVYAADQNTEFIGWAKETLASTMMGQFRSFARDTSLGIDYVAANSTAGDLRIQITEVGVAGIAGGPYDVGDSNGYVAFRFLPEFTVFGKST